MGKQTLDVITTKRWLQPLVWLGVDVFYTIRAVLVRTGHAEKWNRDPLDVSQQDR